MGKLLDLGREFAALVAAFLEELFPIGSLVVLLFGLRQNLVEGVLAGILGSRGPPWFEVVPQLFTVEDRE
jgi:hypothetical protein